MIAPERTEHSYSTLCLFMIRYSHLELLHYWLDVLCMLLLSAPEVPSVTVCTSFWHVLRLFPCGCWEDVAGDPSCLTVVHQMLASQRFTGTAARWQVYVNPVGSCQFLVFSGLILLALLTGFWPWHIPTVAIAGHLLRTTEWTLLPCHSPLPWSTGKRECVHRTGCKSMWLGDSILWGDFEGLGASLQHHSVPEKHRRCILGKTWREYTVTLSHYLFLSFPFSICTLLLYLFLSCTPMHIGKVIWCWI